ncbi:glycerophosphodiester phosphodiesterase family protein [Streptomyces sp. VRA16 Mangrove soil]|uniref:glycerophosphodiester phosphodiesterase n=1 Tax=Streptomyces sp. VRA16 Mangrove soil TaxID=2817434 RepID=UPI001A9E9EF6|nr:glycerophosphodiester phosphodiesterase family protein [Streptomyces sp. VRA16 Mangrove soil]MBO1330644.1 glycerophosphodiester phosphodiesterase [Streptomyces sp. VRA16 Mangrove soil]
MTPLTPGSRPLVFGHRGARTEEPENTLRSFRRAAELGADGIELDIRVSADGHLVVIHDATVDRTTDGEGEVASLTLAQLRSLDAGSGERIPTLDEALAAFPGHVQVEIKAPEAVQVLESLPERAVLTSFHPEILEDAARRLPAVARGLISHTPGDELLRAAKDLGAAWVCPERTDALTPRFVARCHDAGLLVDAWPAADRELMRLFRGLGVDAVTTDHPGRIEEWLAP